MTRRRDDYSSDSDSEGLPEVETSVLLGIPDGLVDNPTDVIDAAVSRIGGHPAFLPSHEPSLTSSQCKICSNPSELLVQMWCPFQDSPMDRALYIWGCARAPCQGKQGSVRAWRGLRRNDRYAEKLEKKLAKKRAAKEAKTISLIQDQIITVQTNPFSTNAPLVSRSFGLGTQIFGDTSPPPPDKAGSGEFTNQYPEEDLDDESDSDDSTHTQSDGELLTAMASATMTDSPWKAAPSYPPLYLSTASEYLSPLPKSKLPPSVQVTDPLDDHRKGSKDKDISWASEAYEDSLEVDHVFERFTKRVGYEGEQCVRYELNGTPLPFSSDTIFASLFPSPPAPALPITKAAFTVTHPSKRTYLPTSIPPCPICHSYRVFECQLMPNLINVLRQPETRVHQSDEDRRKAVERVVKGASDDSGDAHGMEWGTCLVFSCEKDCYMDDNGKETRECWREEVVLIQSAI